MTVVLFFLAALVALAGAIGVVVLRNPFYNVLSLVAHLLALATLFLLLRAQFVAAAQVVVYAGAVMVLYVFVVAYVGTQDEPLGSPGSPLRLVAVVAAGMLMLELFIAVLGSGLAAIDSEGAGLDPGFGSPKAIGALFLQKFLFPFEIASLLLLVAAVGAVVLARRRRGLESGIDEVASIVGLPRPAWTGTMAEAVGDHPLTPALPAGRGAAPDDETAEPEA